MKKNGLFIVLGCLLATAAYAGVAYIDYSTGNFKCTNGYEGHYDMCTGNDLKTFGHENC